MAESDKTSAGGGLHATSSYRGNPVPMFLPFVLPGKPGIHGEGRRWEQRHRAHPLSKWAPHPRPVGTGCPRHDESLAGYPVTQDLTTLSCKHERTPKLNNVIDITLMRHGRSRADDEMVHEGRYDSPLTDVGTGTGEGAGGEVEARPESRST